MRSFLQRLKVAAVIGAASGALMALSCLVSFATGSVLAGGFTGILLGTALMIGSLLVGEDDKAVGGTGAFLALFAAIAAAVAGFVGSQPLLEVRRLRGEEQREVSIAELANHPEGVRFQLRDGSVDAQAVHTHFHDHPSQEHSGASYTHAIAPVLPPGWRPGEPVRVWAVCHDFDDGYTEKLRCLEAWRSPAGGAIAIDPAQEPCYRLAVPTGLAPGDGRLAFVHWVKSPELYIAERWKESLLFLRGIAIGWVLIAELWIFWLTVADVHRSRRASSTR